MHQKYQEVSEVGLYTSWLMQFKIFLGFLQDKSAELDAEFGNKLYVHTHTICMGYIHFYNGWSPKTVINSTEWVLVLRVS